MICKDCKDWFKKTKPNQGRCIPCIEERPHHGLHDISKLGDKYVAGAKKRLAKTVRHWNISMGHKKLVTMFPDLEGRW